MKRYEKIVLEAEKGISFEVSEETSGELIIRALNIDNGVKINKANVYSENYVNPVVPKGYKHICGEWNNGFVIERDSDGSQFVWIPVGYLDSNGTLDGNSFNEKLGRRNYMNDEFSESEYHETLEDEDELALQLESVKKYGGFYISRYNISENKKTGKLQSVKDEYARLFPGYETMRAAASFETSDTITSHLTFGAEYDSVLEWLIKSGAKTRKEIVTNSANWGNYDTPGISKTGSREKWCANNIYDLAGNMAEWTQEKNWSYEYVIRGGAHHALPVAHRGSIDSMMSLRFSIGFRVVLCIK